MKISVPLPSSEEWRLTLKNLRTLGWWGVVFFALVISHSFIISFGQTWLTALGGYWSYALGGIMVIAMFSALAQALRLEVKSKGKRTPLEQEIAGDT